MEQQDNQEKIITIFEPQKQNQTANLLIKKKKYIYIYIYTYSNPTYKK